jgi:hypothetical protein
MDFTVMRVTRRKSGPKEWTLRTLPKGVLFRWKDEISTVRLKRKDEGDDYSILGQGFRQTRLYPEDTKVVPVKVVECVVEDQP